MVTVGSVRQGKSYRLAPRNVLWAQCCAVKRLIITSGASGGEAYEVSGIHGGAHHSDGEARKVCDTHGDTHGDTHSSGRDGDVSRTDKDTSKSRNILCS
jgi:hypothetical protein